MNAVWKSVAASDQTELPVEIRRLLGVEHGSRVMIVQDGAEIRLRSVADVGAWAQALTRDALKDAEEFSADAFLQGRMSLWGERPAACWMPQL